MRRLLIPVFALFLVGVAASCSSDDSATGAESTTTAVATGGADSTDADGGTAVATEGTSYSPKELTVKVGDTVTFTNTGGSHSVTPDIAKGWNEGGVSVADWSEAGAVYETTFTDAGTFAYHCQIHGGTGGSGMSGVIVVE